MCALDKLLILDSVSQTSHSVSSRTVDSSGRCRSTVETSSSTQVLIAGPGGGGEASRRRDQPVLQMLGGDTQLYCKVLRYVRTSPTVLTVACPIYDSSVNRGRHVLPEARRAKPIISQSLIGRRFPYSVEHNKTAVSELGRKACLPLSSLGSVSYPRYSSPPHHCAAPRS